MPPKKPTGVEKKRSNTRRNQGSAQGRRRSRANSTLPSITEEMPIVATQSRGTSAMLSSSCLFLPNIAGMQDLRDMITSEATNSTPVLSRVKGSLKRRAPEDITNPKRGKISREEGSSSERSMSISQSSRSLARSANGSTTGVGPNRGEGSTTGQGSSSGDGPTTGGEGTATGGGSTSGDGTTTGEGPTSGQTPTAPGTPISSQETRPDGAGNAVGAPTPILVDIPATLLAQSLAIPSYALMPLYSLLIFLKALLDRISSWSRRGC